MIEAARFDVLGRLPHGVAVLEASAGTGKTFTLAALAARYVADGLGLDALLMVTFTRMATGELRERVRERLVSAERALEEVLGGAPLPADDAVAALLATGPADAVALRRRRLATALADFDAATITTTHGFCLEALSSLGVAGDVAGDCAFVEDVDDLLEEVVDDLYVRRFRGHPPVFSREQAGVIARAAVANPTAHLEPVEAPPTSAAAMRLRLAVAVRAELEARKHRAGVMTYDDLLTRLDATLAAPDAGPILARLRTRYAVVLVDEFQDTDPTQWSIMHRAFGHADGTLVLIGDPKQAIYAFRGADVYAYLRARRHAGTFATLAENWRSDQGLLDAYDALFGEARLGDAGIAYRRTRATAAHRAPRLHGAARPEPLRIRVVDAGSPRLRRTPSGALKVDSARTHVADDVADEAVALLSGGAEIERRPLGATAAGTPAISASPGSADGPRRPVRPGDLAVLVRRNRDAATIRDALHARGVPAVVAGAGSVFAAPAAEAWLALLEALERPSSAPRARAAALTSFLGWDARTVATAGDEAWSEVHRRLHGWAQVLRERGVAALESTITRAEGLPRRLLATDDGERTLTDLRHVGQLLHAAAATEQLGVAALTAWLRRRIAEAGRDGDEERTRRLESDAAAVQVLTIHRSKGLEFPIVFYPYLWDPTWFPEEGEPVAFHDPEHDHRRTLDVGLDGPHLAARRRRHRDEQRGEDLRLAYVALTRARHQAIVWWAASYDSRNSALGRLLFAQDHEGTVAPAVDRGPRAEEVTARLAELAARAPGRVSVERSAPARQPARWRPEPPPRPELAGGRFDRTVDRTWRRTSYSDLTAAAGHEAVVGSEAEPEDRLQDGERPGASDRSDAPGHSAPGGGTADDPHGLRAHRSALEAMPGGVRVGTLVHELLEAADLAATDLEGELAARLAELRPRRPVSVGDEDVFVAALAAAVRTPLGANVDGRRLADLTRADRLDELAFELPLAGGDTRGAPPVTPGAIGALLREHLPAGDPFAAYADWLDDPGLRGAVRGYLTGSIDLVFRLPGPGGRARYALADYKTNRLGVPGQPLTAFDYRPEALREAMFASHYALQGLLYTVALHRYLRWRVADYDPERDLAGIAYLFLRGMAGPDGPTVDAAPCGVFSWRPPGQLVVSLSDLLDRGAA